jgi:putative two-component system response regulator
MHVLIADDDSTMLSLLECALVEYGYTVHSARNGLEALGILRRGECRLVITDWVMPRMDGLELCRAIRSGDFFGYVYIILLTARDSHDDTIEGLSAGADDFVVKPFDPAELKMRIRAGERVLSLETRDVALFAMAKLAESRDPETGAHLERVRSFSRILAQNLSRKERFRETVDAEFIRLVYQTSPLHDMGKLAIPDTVLLKPGRLSDREFHIMKSHTTLGAQTLDAALERFPEARFLQMAREIVACHHERYDGTGYPGGLSGEDIPLSARIVALADVYDALTSRRVYKEAFAHEVARSIIESESGSHFDRDIVEVFMENEHLFAEIHNRLSQSVLVRT